jgi:hypothetical protein
MTQVGAPTKWRYIVECQDNESGSIYVIIGSANDREECEGRASQEVGYQRDLYRHVVNAEACELCQECEGDGVVLSSEPSAHRTRCGACDGHLGPFTRIKFSFHARRSFLTAHSKAA